MGFCTGVLVLISTPPDDTNVLLSLSHAIESPGKLLVTVQLRESEFSSLGGTCGPVSVTIGGTASKNGENDQLNIIIPINLTKYSQSGQTGTRITCRVTTSTLIISTILESNT